MRHLVGEDRGHLGLGARGLDQPAVDVHEPARQRERVDVRCVDDADLVGILRPGRGRGQPADDLGRVALDAAVVEQRELAFGLGGRLPADLHVLLLAEEVEAWLDLRRLREQRRGRDGHDRQPGDGGHQYGAAGLGRHRTPRSRSRGGHQAARGSLSKPCAMRADMGPGRMNGGPTAYCNYYTGGDVHKRGQGPARGRATPLAVTLDGPGEAVLVW